MTNPRQILDEETRLQYLQAMGIQAWEPRTPRVSEQVPVKRQEPAALNAQLPQDPPKAVAVGEKSLKQSVGQDNVSMLDWDSLQAKVESCTACELHAGRIHTVFGVGNRSARLLLIGEAPGADEDVQGEPFVGRAGKLLNEMLYAMGFQREDVYIANILKCRPPNNRDPKPEEVVCCEPFLYRQIDLIQPDVILALGRIAAQNLLKTDITLGKLRGQIHTFPTGEIPVIVTYHPAYLLRSPREKRKVWEDLQTAMNLLK